MWQKEAWKLTQIDKNGSVEKNSTKQLQNDSVVHSCLPDGVWEQPMLKHPAVLPFALGSPLLM